MLTPNKNSTTYQDSNLGKNTQKAPLKMSIHLTRAYGQKVLPAVSAAPHPQSHPPL